ncbi:MAG: SOS response-associated peptidase [Myxococcales bacterium]|nr:SOS response-associated peptidase [Myxococcales bacterium]MCB9732827.1 SOS response-associated peptidase [Deltaproteobacteria bacterium]
MCGRYAVAKPWNDVIEALEALPEDAAAASHAATYNICPTDPAPIVRAGEDGGARVAAVHRWGLVPWWAPDTKGAARLINARSETVRTTRAFRDAFKGARCLVPASGFYEWTAKPGGQKGKIPHWIHPEDGEMLTFAGLWARWGPKGSDGHWSFTILTTSAAPSVSVLHDRMPVVIGADDRERWLDPAADLDGLMGLLAPWEGALAHHRVGPGVNDVRADGPELVRPAAAELELAL